MGLKTQILIATLLVFLLFHSKPASSEEVDDEHEFSYVKGSENGPDHWAEIHEDWSACGKGKMQSPIDLLDKTVQVIHQFVGLNRRYKPSNATLVNRGHDIMLKWEEGAGTINVNGTEYTLKQCHWHSPSEHTIDGRRYALEVHMVHESVDKKIAAVGVLYTLGRQDPFISELTGHFTSIENIKEGNSVVGIVDPRHITLGGGKYYRYMGSLTAPPCTEGVTWTILKKVMTVSPAQVKLLRSAVHDGFEKNSRPTQLINNRMVHFYSRRKNCA